MQVIRRLNFLKDIYKMKFGICNEIFKGWSWEKIVKAVSSYGYNGIEIAPFTFAESVKDISEEKRKEIRNIALQNNIEIIGLHWLLASPPGMSLSSVQKEVRENTISYLKELINFCADLGGKIMVFGSPKQREIQASSNYKDTYNYLKEGFLKILSLAAQRDVIIALEPLARAETNFINTAGEALSMVKEINHPNFRLNLDVKAMSDEKKPISEIIESAKGYLVHFHANDPNLLGPGSGKVDYKPIRKALQNIRYDGYISVEVFDFKPGPEKIAQNSLRYLKEIF